MTIFKFISFGFQLTFVQFLCLTSESKISKLGQAFDKIYNKVEEMKWIFKCCRNYPEVVDVYDQTLDLVCNLRSYAWHVLQDDDIEVKPACFTHKPSVFGLDFLYEDLLLMVDVVWISIKTGEVTDVDKFDILFELGNAVYDGLHTIAAKQISIIRDES